MEVEFGPAMLALTEKQRRFVLAMAADPFGSASDWARLAGYADCGANPRVKAHLNLHSEAVQAAVLEYSRGMLNTIGPMLATTAMLRAAANTKNKNHLRAAEMIANRVGLHEVQEVHVRKTDQTGAAMVERLRALAKKHGLDADALIGGNVTPLMIEGRAENAIDDVSRRNDRAMDKAESGVDEAGV
jgi:phage terminase small subunit